MTSKAKWEVQMLGSGGWAVVNSYPSRSGAMRAAAELKGRTRRVASIGAELPQSRQLPTDSSGLTLDEHQVLDACMFGATKTEIVQETALTKGQVDRLVKRMVASGYLRPIEAPDYPGGRQVKRYRQAVED